MCYTTPVFAKPTLDDEGHLHVYNWDDIKDCAVDWVMYMASNIGAIFSDHNFGVYVQNKESWKDYWKEENVTISEDGRSVNFSTDLMAYVKQCLDDYAAENQPFTVQKTYKMTDISPNYFHAKVVYDYFKSFFDSDSYEYIILSVSGGSGHIADVAPVIKEGGCFYTVNPGDSLVRMLSPDWSIYRASTYKFGYKYDPNSGYSLNVSDAEDYRRFEYFHKYDAKRTDFSKNYSLFTKDGGNIRVFNSRSDFINYSVGQRKIYYTSEYYNYVPEDLQVSIDDLQKTIDDMQDVIDKLLDQITNNTSESEIEELLRQILEELKNNQGGNSGGDGSGGSGGGDVNVDIDLNGTNSLLSKILAKVTQIFDKITSSAGQTTKEVTDSINALGEMLKKYLKTITGDLDEIKNHLDEMTEEQFSEKADSFLNETAGSFSEIGEVAKGKFPFSIPNDMRTLLELLSIPPPSPETAALYDAGSPAIQPLSSGHGGGGTTRPPTGGIASVEQGNSGGSFGISESGAPVIRCPIVIKRLGIDYAIKIDLSEFDKVAALARTFLTFLFIYGLYNLTFKVIGLWGDLTE